MLKGFNPIYLISQIWAYSGLRTLTAGSYSVIKSITPISITYGSSATTATQTISAVVVAKSVVVWGGETFGTAGSRLLNASELVLTNTTTVTATRASGVDASANDSPGTVTGAIVEFW